MATVYVWPARVPEEQVFQSAIDDIYKNLSGCTLVEYGRALFDGMDGLWATFNLPEKGRREPRLFSMLSHFEIEGWFVKYRCTHINGTHDEVRRDVETLIRQVGWPDTSKRLVTGHHAALARSAEAFKTLQSWSPPCSPIALETLHQVNELRSKQRFAEAIATIRERINGEDAPAGLHAEFCRLSLLTGDLLDAVEECMAEEEVSTSEQPVLEAALQAFASEAVGYTGGWGATPGTPVRITGAATDHIHVNAVHKYLEFVLGRRGRDWKLDRACLITHGDQLLDAMCVN